MTRPWRIPSGAVKDAGPYAKRNGWPPPSTPMGAAAGAMAVGRELRHLRMALWTIRDFAPYAAQMFRPLRRAGVSLAAASGYFARCDGRVFRPVRGATRGAASGLRDFLKKIE